MAHPITVTPVLLGEEAELFLKKIKRNESRDRKITDEEHAKAIENYRKFDKIAKF